MSSTEEDDQYGFTITTNTEEPEGIPRDIVILYNNMYKVCAKELFLKGRTFYTNK